MPARQVDARVILVDDPGLAARVAGGGSVWLYARVSSHDQLADLDRQVARLSEWAAKAGMRVERVEAEVGSGMNGSRKRVRILLIDPDAGVILVEHRCRLGRMNTELVEAALSATGRLVVVDDGEVEDDVVRDMTELLTSFCATPNRTKVSEEPCREGTQVCCSQHRTEGTDTAP